MSDELDMSKVCICEDFANPNCRVCFPPVAEAPLIVRHGLTEKWWIIQRDNGASDPIGPFDTKEEAGAAAEIDGARKIAREALERGPYKVAAPIAPAGYESEICATGLCGEMVCSDSLCTCNCHADQPTRLLAAVMHLWVDGYISKSPDSAADDSISANVFEEISRFLEAAGIEVDYCGWRRVSRPEERNL